MENPWLSLGSDFSKNCGSSDFPWLFVVGSNRSRRRQAAWGQDLKDGGQLIDFDGAVAVEVESAIAQGPAGPI
mgnify:CR=1 FL=1